MSVRIKIKTCNEGTNVCVNESLCSGGTLVTTFGAMEILKPSDNTTKHFLACHGKLDV